MSDKEISVRGVRPLVFELDAERAAEDGIPVVVSTEHVCEMPDGLEVLVHSAEAVNLERAPLPIIATHKSGQINVGNIDALEIRAGQLRGLAKFGARAEAREYETDVKNGTIRSVSVGYRRNKGHFRQDGVLMVTRWTPMHAAMVAEPADIGAGFYRERGDSGAFELEQDPAEQQRSASSADTAATTKGNEMPEATTPAAAGGSTANLPGNVITETRDFGAEERGRIEYLRRLGEQCKIDGKTVQSWIDDGMSEAIAARTAVDIMSERQKHSQKDAPSYLGLSPNDVRRYSVTRAIKACVEKSWPRVAPFEAEVSEAMARKLGRTASGEHTFFIPLDVQWAAAAQRDLVVGTSSAGGFLVGTNTQSFIEVLRNRSVVIRLGATMMPGLVGSVSIPKQLTPSTANWFASEAGTATESNLTFGQLPLSPKTVGGYVEISRQLLLQSTPNAEGIVNTDLARVLGLALDTAALVGPGTAGQPSGIAATSGVGTANPAAGTNVGYADMIKFQTTVAASNAMMPGFGYVTTPTIAGILMGKPRFTNSDTPIWGGNILDGMVVGAPAMSTLQVSSGTMFGGDFSNVVIGEWGVLEIEANPYAQFQSGIVGVRALYSVDVGIRYGAAFAIGTGMTA